MPNQPRQRDVTEPVNLDADLGNADWIKIRTWDLPATLEECDAAGIDLIGLLSKPAGMAMPPELRAQAVARQDALARSLSKRKPSDG